MAVEVSQEIGVKTEDSGLLDDSFGSDSIDSIVEELGRLHLRVTFTPTRKQVNQEESDEDWLYALPEPGISHSPPPTDCKFTSQPPQSLHLKTSSSQAIQAPSSSSPAKVKMLPAQCVKEPPMVRMKGKWDETIGSYRTGSGRESRPPKRYMFE